MALLLTEDDVRQVLTMDMALAAVEEAHRELAHGRAIDIPRQRSRLPQTTLHILQGALPAHLVERITCDGTVRPVWLKNASPRSKRPRAGRTPTPP